jgi:ComF family protein
VRDILAQCCRSAGRIIFVRTCLVCERPIHQGDICRHCLPSEPLIIDQLHCIQCSNQLEAIASSQVCSYCINLPSLLAHQRYLWLYQGLIRDLIIAMKYSPSKRLAHWGAEQLLANIQSQFAGVLTWDTIIAIPSSPKNYANRLFSPSRIMADYIAKSLTIPAAHNILFHRDVSQSQATLSHAERHSNAQRSLWANSKKLHNKRILLIDDVVTTGATALSSAQLLLKCGAHSVDLYSLARAPSWDSTRRLGYKR